MTEDAKKGAFLESLKRNNKQIRDDRAAAIGEDTQLTYKRMIEDIEINIKRLKRKQENMLDLSPANAQNLKLAEDFDVDSYTKEDLSIGITIRNEQLKLEIAKDRYNYLFGGE